MDVTAADELIEHLVEFYDRTAGEYDSWAGGLNSRVAAKLVELAHPKRGQASLDEAVRLLRPGGRIAVSMQRRSLHTEAQELFYTELGKLAGRHHLRIPQHSTERAELGERHNLLSLLEEFGLKNVKMTELVTGGRVGSPGEWTAIITGNGPLRHWLTSVRGAVRRGKV